MSGILLIATFVFLFFFGYHMVGLLDHFLDSNRFCPQDESPENIPQNEDLTSQEFAGYHPGTVNRAS